MSIKKIMKAQEQHRLTRIGQLGLKVEGGEILADDDGLLLLIEEKELKKGQKYNIKLPHVISLSRNIGLLSLPVDVANKMEFTSFPTFLSLGEGYEIEVSLKPKEDCVINKLLKISLMELVF